MLASPNTQLDGETVLSLTESSSTARPHLMSRLLPFRRDHQSSLSPASSSKKEPSKLKMFLLRRPHSSSSSGNGGRGLKKVVSQKGSERFGGIRASTSTHLTTEARSSLFLMMEPSGFFGQSEADDPVDLTVTQTELTPDERVEESVAEEEPKDSEQQLPAAARMPSTAALRPLRRSPSPEGYYELTKNEHDELGYIQLEFDNLADAQEEAARRQQPILCIEAEIPANSTAGETIFSHPLIVEAAESLFVTVRPTPEEPQDDRGRYFSNSSCRTRVRVLDEEGMDIIPCVEHMSTAEVVAAMVEGLEAYTKHVPRYLSLLLEESSGKLEVISKTRFREIQGIAVFGMFDSTVSEVELAGLDGVLSTRAGVVTRQKVVQVTYDSKRLPYCALVRYALRHANVNVVYYETNEERIAAQMEVGRHEECLQRRRERHQQDDAGEDSSPKEDVPDRVPIKVTEQIGNMRSNFSPKPALRESILRFVPLTDLQACKANRLIYLNRFNEAMHLLSPRQGLIAMQAVRQHHYKIFQDVVDVPIEIAWKELSQAKLSYNSQ